MKKKIVSVLAVFIVLMFLGEVLAITGSIGNARMILRAKTGDKIEKYVLVKNINDVPLNIKLFATGDLEKDIKLNEEEFRLEAGEEKKAYFTIKVTKEGTTETKINVQFSPDDGPGVGLSSTVIVISGEGNAADLETEETTENTEEQENGGVSITTGHAIAQKFSPVTIGLTITAIIFVILITLLLAASKKNKSKKRVKRNA